MRGMIEGEMFGNLEQRGRKKIRFKNMKVEYEEESMNFN
jgi:hypothetical protein